MWERRRGHWVAVWGGGTWVSVGTGQVWRKRAICQVWSGIQGVSWISREQNSCPGSLGRVMSERNAVFESMSRHRCWVFEGGVSESGGLRKVLSLRGGLKGWRGEGLRCLRGKMCLRGGCLRGADV